MFYVNAENEENSEEGTPTEEFQMSVESKQALQQFWPKVMEDIKKANLLDTKQQQILPLARIKKIMKLDEDVKMISAEAPLLFAKAAEIFIHELTLRSWIHTEDNKRRTLQKNDIAMAITKYDQFDFLIDIVPRDEIKMTTTNKTKDSDQTIKGVTPANPDQVQYYFQLAQQHQQALQQTDNSTSTQQPSATIQTTPAAIQIIQPQQLLTIDQTNEIAQNQTSGANQTSTPSVSNQATSVNSTNNIQIVQQIVTPTGEIQQIPIQLSPQQMQMIRMQLQATPAGATQQPIIIQASPTQQATQQPILVPQNASQPIFLTTQNTSSSTIKSE